MTDDDRRSPTPLEDLHDEVARRRVRPNDGGDLFERQLDAGDVDLDPEALWDALTQPLSTPAEPDSADERDVRVVDKRRYCERCRYLSRPPDVYCTHDGTDIVRLDDVESFLVADCPVASGDEQIDRGHLGGADRTVD